MNAGRGCHADTKTFRIPRESFGFRGLGLRVGLGLGFKLLTRKPSTLGLDYCRVQWRLHPFVLKGQLELCPGDGAIAS